MFLPGIRFGTYWQPQYTAAYVVTTPFFTTASTGTGEFDGSWLYPDRRFCNPLGWMANTKMAIAQVQAAATGGDKKSAAVFTKLVLCLNANCTADDTACPPKSATAANKLHASSLTMKSFQVNTSLQTQKQTVQWHTTHSQAVPTQTATTTPSSPLPL